MSKLKEVIMDWWAYHQAPGRFFRYTEKPDFVEKAENGAEDKEVALAAIKWYSCQRRSLTTPPSFIEPAKEVLVNL